MSDEKVHRRPAGDGGEERPRAPAGAHERLRELTVQIGGELATNRTELTECRFEAERLRLRLEALEREHRSVCDGHATLEQQVAELGNLCVVMERVHGALEYPEVLAAVQDVVVNVIGSEELALFEVSADGEWLRPVQCLGVESRGLGPVAVGSGPIGRAAAERRGWVVGEGPPPAELPDLTACVPLVIRDRPLGVLAIWRMLAHKPEFGEGDRAVLELLARHAATALHLTSPRERDRPRVQAV